MDWGSFDRGVQRLDDAAAAAERVVVERLELLRLVVRLHADSGWKLSGARTAACWLKAYAGLGGPDAQRLAKMARLAARYPVFADAVFTRQLSLAQAETLAQWVTDEREPAFADMIATLVGHACHLADPDDFATVVRHWAGLVDQELAKPPRVQPHAIYLSQGLFGGGEIHGRLAETSFLTIAAALDAFDSGPDPTNGPIKARSTAARRADALDDLAHFGLTHDPDQPHDSDPDPASTPDQTEPAAGPDQTTQPTPDTTRAPDEAHPGEPDTLAADPDESGTGQSPDDAADDDCPRPNRAQRRRRQRRTRRRSAATINVIIDLLTLSGRDPTDLTGLDLRTNHWRIGHAAAQRLLCDAGLVATLMAGHHTLLDATDRTETFTAAQRRALAVRDRHCVFPSCNRPAHWCDAHHLDPKSGSGTDTIANAALFCRHHHRLIHEHRWTLHVDHHNQWVATDPHGIEWTGRPHGHTQRPRTTHRQPAPA